MLSKLKLLVGRVYGGCITMNDRGERERGELARMFELVANSSLDAGGQRVCAGRLGKNTKIPLGYSSTFSWWTTSFLSSLSPKWSVSAHVEDFH